MTDVSIVLPVYNESGNIEPLYRQLTSVLQGMDCSYEIIMVDDGSTDDSFAKIRKLAQRDPCVLGLALSRNFGHQIALTAGVDQSQGQAVIMMDADLQHLPSLIPELVARYKAGYDIVTTVRQDDRTIPLAKRLTSALFYKVINALSDTPIEPAAADFRLMSRKAVEAFKQVKEHTRFTRGLISWMGFSHTTVPYQPNPRFAGVSKYSLRKMMRFALDGLTAFSATPLRVSFYLGMMLSFGALLYALYALSVFLQHKAVPGWTSILMAVLLLGGIQLISLGILGEYQARIFEEVKRRPLYFIDKDTRYLPPG